MRRGVRVNVEKKRLLTRKTSGVSSLLNAVKDKSEKPIKPIPIARMISWLVHISLQFFNWMNS